VPIVRSSSFAFLFFAASLPAQVITLPTEIVTASRAPQSPEHAASTVHVLEQSALRSAPSLTLDGTLRALPGFSLFRRSDSLTANPTAQGVSLRGLGPSGASRSLVLLDGVPLNDPFGGWIAWTKVPRESLTRVEVVPGGGASAWGNAALGGVIQMLSPGGIAARRTTHALATVGDFGTRSIEFSHREPGQRAELDVDARAFATDGFSLMAPERRGPIDIAAWSRHRWLSARWRQSIGNQLEFSATARGYEEKRGNGTPYQQNSSREKFISLALAGQPANEFAWNAVAYAQDQTFASTFSGVNATRTAETPASDQFAVPATAIGAAWTGVWRHLGAGTGAALSRSVAGVDARFVRGETREHFTFSAGNFTRLRVAGGRQEIAGVFAMHERRIGDDVRGTIGVRLDRWAERDGHRRESDRATNVFLRDERYPDREGTSFSPNLGLVWRVPDSPRRVRVNVQRASRRPTLNELYRPFRVGPNITEANAALGTEHVTSA
jgi:outer membrane cobalamin receptor